LTAVNAPSAHRAAACLVYYDDSEVAGFSSMRRQPDLGGAVAGRFPIIPRVEEKIMALVKWEPWREMEDLFDRYVKSFGGLRAGTQEPIATGDWSPRVDISETDGEFVVKAEIPEVKKEDVRVTVEHGVLTLQGERKQEKEEKGKKFHRIERYYGSFRRSFSLPENVDESKVAASFKDGMLTIQLPKTSQAKPQSIEVKVD
jgi:HSP20 family protein